MLLTIFSTFASETWGAGAILGTGLLMGLVLALALSAQRWLLWYLFGGMAYWLAVEAIYSLLSYWSVLSEWHNYVVAMGISWLPLIGWVLYRVCATKTSAALYISSASYKPPAILNTRPFMMMTINRAFTNSVIY